MNTPDPVTFYVTAIKDSGEWVPLAGPYPTHADALDAVGRARRRAAKVDARACWYAYGTARNRGAALVAVFGVI